MSDEGTVTAIRCDKCGSLQPIARIVGPDINHLKADCPWDMKGFFDCIEKNWLGILCRLCSGKGPKGE